MKTSFQMGGLLFLFAVMLTQLPSRGADPPAASTHAPAPASGPVPTVALDVSVVRFKPLKADRVLQGFKDLTGDLASVIERLQKEGEVSVLYNATREVRLENNNMAKFDALETRPVVIIGHKDAPLPPATSYGVTLEIIARTMDTNRFGLSWTGSVSWSPEIVDRWKGDKFLSFVNTAAGLAKTASTLTGDSAKVNASADMGLGLAELFNPKGKPTDNEIYELPVNKTISFQSSRNCRSGELLVNSTTAEMGNKEAQTILLLILPTLHP